VVVGHEGTKALGETTGFHQGNGFGHVVARRSGE
jgi:hypothetical protein